MSSSNSSEVVCHLLAEIIELYPLELTMTAAAVAGTRLQAARSPQKKIIATAEIGTELHRYALP
jgi:hypothetical protein